MAAQIDRARGSFAVDLSVGDPIEPGPQTISMPTLLGAAPLSLLGYPLEMVLAEKTVTALERGTVNTRWRDFADVWTLSRRQDCSGDDLQVALRTVSEHRGAALEPLLPALDGMPELVQPRWSTWRAKQALPVPIPETFAELLEDLVAFTTPPLVGTASGCRWNPEQLTWQSESS